MFICERNLLVGNNPHFFFCFSYVSSSYFSSVNYTYVLLFLSLDTYAMAGMALQCVKDAGSHVHNAAELDTALSNIKQKLLASRRNDGHIGNEFSTGLAVQVRIFIFLFHA